jgi:hypothetical protein
MVQRSNSAEIAARSAHGGLYLFRVGGNHLEMLGHDGLGGCYPLIQHLVQANVCESWRDDPALGSSFGVVGPVALFQDVGVQLFVDHTPGDIVDDSLVEKAPKLISRYRVGMSQDNDIQHRPRAPHHERRA